MTPSETISLLGGGFLLGLSIAVPLGPINLEMIRRGVGTHPVAGLAVGLGATSLDTICILASGFGLGWLVENKGFAVLCYGVGALLLAWMGLDSIRDGRARWHAAAQPVSGAGEAAATPEAHRFWRGFAYGLGIHAANPVTYVFWTTVPLMFFREQAPSRAMVLMTTGAVLAGCMAWNLTLVGLIAVARRFLKPRFLAGTCLVGGAALLVFAVVFGIKAVGGILGR